MKLYEVAVAAPLYGTLTYSQMPGSSSGPLPGMRVLVPLGHRLVTGYLLGPTENINHDQVSYEIKSIVDQLDPDPVFPPELIPFFRWIADYYHYPLGEVIKTALPGGMVVRSGKKVLLTVAGQESLAEEIDKLKKKYSWMHRLLETGELKPATVNGIRRKAATARLLEKWCDAGWITMEDVLVSPSGRGRKVTMVSLAAGLDVQQLDVNGRTFHLLSGLVELSLPETKTLEMFFLLKGERSFVPRPELTRTYSGAGMALHSLVGKGIFCFEEQRCYRNPFGKVPPFFAKPVTLTDEQEKNLASLFPVVDNPCFKPFLLFGVTGCGKTEVYLRSAERCLQQGKKVLVLVPEIALASQLEAHFYSRFGDNLAVLHSGLSTGERFGQWQRILTGKASVVIGARSAVFAPCSDLGLIIVDEEHENAYKQDDGLRYNGRDLAVLRAKFADCPILLGSATPSITSFYHAKNNKYTLLTMKHRVNEQAMPKVQVVDLSKEKRSRPDLFFSDQLTLALHENMEQRMQSLLFVNRRGYSSFMLCSDCGHIIQCRYCQVSLTHHRKDNRLVCHYCGYTVTPQITCPECRSGKLRGLGVGSERIEQEVRQLIPHARVARLDSDTTRDRKAYMAILQQVRNHEVDILIGTQMVAKGLHFPHMTLVGVVWADSGLGMPDYKAPERTFQMLTQVTGRSGRGEIQGRVIIQTHQPEHYAIKFACKQDYEQMYDQEISLRAGLAYPPFGRLVNICFSGESEEAVVVTAEKTGQFLQGLAGLQSVDILGPAPAPLSRIKNKYRWHMLLKSRHLKELHVVCDLLLQERAALCKNGVRMLIDVDPENMM